LKIGRKSGMRLALAFLVVLTIIFASLSVYEYQAATNGALALQSSALTKGMLVRNGTFFDVASINITSNYSNGTIGSITNGTTVVLRDVAFTFISTHSNLTRPGARFVVTSLTHGWSETLVVTSPAAPQPQIDEVYTSHDNPRAGLGMTYNSPIVQLLVGTSSA
jgi:hypothetical protein